MDCVDLSLSTAAAVSRRDLEQTSKNASYKDALFDVILVVLEDGVRRTMKEVLLAAVALLPLLLTTGCQKPVAANLPGTYVAEYEGGTDKLMIDSTGSYSHMIASGTEGTLNAGKWEVETLPGEQLGVSFADFRFRTRGGAIKPAGVWHVRVQVRWQSSAYELCFDPDSNDCFVHVGR